jgi:hypothetical protein
MDLVKKMSESTPQKKIPDVFNSHKKLFVIGLVIFCFSLNYSSSIASESNSLTSSDSQQSKTSGKTNENQLIEMLIDRLDILLGFALGLCGTIFIDSLRKRRSLKEFRKGMRTELKQSLAIVNYNTLNTDAEINAAKIRSWQSLSKEFDLFKAVSPLADSTIHRQLTDRNLEEADIEQLVALRRLEIAQRSHIGFTQSFRKVKCTFIQNNISLISLLPKKNQALLINILRRLEALNEVVPRLDFCFHKSYDSNVTSEDHERLKTVYLTGLANIVKQCKSL